MSTETISLGDIGTDFQVTVTEGGSAVDISSAATLQIEFTKPDGTVVTQTASLVNSGTDGKMQYVTDSDDIDQQGIWTYRGKVTFSAGVEVFFTNNPKQFTVV